MAENLAIWRIIMSNLSKQYKLNSETRRLEHITEWPHELPRSEFNVLQMSNKQIDVMMLDLGSKTAVPNTSPFMKAWVNRE